jgi:UDP-N-acetylmuramoyl-tripeptide--D-alanyl-D-alanine ligase
MLSGGPEGHGPLAERELTEVVIDSRRATPGSLFVALRGEAQDGHEYVADAFRRGAVAALVSRPLPGCGTTWPVEGAWPDAAVEGPLCLQVPDVLRALQDVAAAWRRRQASCRVIAVTGSLGKTSSKEAIATVLAQRYRVLRNEGNLNNEIGLPLTLLKLDRGHARAVLEMGMYAIGEIARLVEIAAPAVGVVTNVGPVHLERLGSIEAIARAKAELPEGLPAEGVLVLNGDDGRVRAMARQTPAARVITYGLNADCDLYASGVESHGLRGLEAVFHYQGAAHPVRLPWVGRHHVYVALAAAAVGLAEGLSWAEITAGLREGGALGRMEVLQGLAGATVLNDAYNACPASVTADLDLLAELGGRRLALLGDMLELGAYEEEGHREVGRRAAEVLDVLAVVGPRARWIAEEARSRNPSLLVTDWQDRCEAAAWLQRQLRAGDHLLVKASHSVGLEEVVPLLCGEGA